MIKTNGLRVMISDRLVKQWRDPKTRKVYRVGKRVAGDCPLHHDEIRSYVEGDFTRAVKTIRTMRNCSLHTARKLLNEVRGRPKDAR